MRARLLACVLTATSALAGCGGEGTDPVVPAADPGLPMAELLDSASFVQAVRALAQSGAATGVTDIRLSYAMYQGSVSWIAPLQESPTAATDSLEAVLRRVAKPTTLPAAQEGITLGIKVGLSPAVTAHPSVIERPRLANQTDITALLQELAGKGVIGSWDFLLRLDRAGRVVEVVAQKKTGDDRADNLVMGVMANCQFVPQKIDGFAVPVWVGLPVTIR
jgi:hypothetical protein